MQPLLIGHSMGAGMSAIYTAVFPEKVSKKWFKKNLVAMVLVGKFPYLR
jgi:hypothetical protein